MEKKKRKTLREYAIDNNMKYLIDEWDEEKNGMSVDEVDAGDREQRHWKMHYYDKELNKEFIFEWETKPATRCFSKINCPYLSGQKVWNGYNDFESRSPDLARQWHPTKNGNLKPTDVSFGSKKKVWWLCPDCSHEYQMKILDRRHGQNCPRCAKELQTSFPEYAIIYYLKQYISNVKHSYIDFGFELDIYLPNLNIAIEYDGSYWHKNKFKQDIEKNKKCEELGIKIYRIREGLDSLNDYSVDILCKNTSESLNNAIMQLFYNILNKKIDIDINRDRSKIERNRIYIKKENSLATRKPLLVTQWHPTKNGNLKPENVTIGSHRKVWWLYSYDDPKTGKHFDFEWESTIANRTRGNNCPYPSGNNVWKGFNDLVTVRPDLAEQWHPTKNGSLTPYDVTEYSAKKVWWLYPYDDPKTGKHFDFEWESTITNRINSNNCPYLTGHNVWKGFNDLATVRPDLAEQWHPTKNGSLTPYDVTEYSTKKVWWLYPYDDPKTGKHFDFEWESTIASRTNGSNCPYLTGRKIWKGFNDLATVRPDLAKQWHPTKNGSLTPYDVTEYSRKKVWWLYSYDDPKTGKHFDFEWETVIETRTKS